jgi:DNA-binding response OmpR family regulator
MVMVAEDDAMVRGLARDILSRHGYEVLVAENPQKAIDLASSYPDTIDLLLSDVIMPGMNGVRLYERLRATRPDLQVIFMSGYPDDVIEHHGIIDAGAPFFQKPFSVAGLIEKVRAILDSSRTRMTD